MSIDIAAVPAQQSLALTYTSSALIEQVIAEHHKKGEEWLLFRELRTSTGAGKARSIDLYAMHTWPSGRYRRIAYEVKVSRGDFLREVKDPQKRRPAVLHSNQFYFVTPPGLLKPAEIPIDCGLIEVDLSIPLQRDELLQAVQLEMDTFREGCCRPLLPNERGTLVRLEGRRFRIETMRCCEVIVDAYWRESMPPDWPFVTSMLRHGRV